MGATLDGYPTWNQNSDPDPTQGADPFATTDCGEECCAIVQYGMGQGYVTETQVRERMPDHQGRGQTSGMDIAGYLNSVGVRAQRLVVAPNNLNMTIRMHVAARLPCILLGNFVSPTVLHWVVAVGYGNDHLLYNDPWDGRMKAMHWEHVKSLFAGEVVSVSRG